MPALFDAWPSWERRQRALATLFAALITVPVAVRTWTAIGDFRKGSVIQAANDLELAGLVASDWPNAVVAVHDIGALSWRTDSPIVDLAGLATNEVTALHLEKRLSTATFSEVVNAHHVDLAWTDGNWLPGAQPPEFRRVGTLEYSRYGLKSQTLIWAVAPGLDARLRASLLGHRGGLLPGVWLDVVGDQALSTEDVTVTGPASEVTPSRVALYANGSATVTAPIRGRLLFAAWGDLASGRGPRMDVRKRAEVRSFEVAAEAVVIDVGEVDAGERVEMDFSDDAADRWGGDRNLYLSRFTIAP